jgi:hypothetical protein
MARGAKAQVALHGPYVAGALDTVPRRSYRSLMLRANASAYYYYYYATRNTGRSLRTR